MDTLQVSQPNASRHLKLMKAAGLVEEQRDGRWVYYRLKDADSPFLNSLGCCIEAVCSSTDIGEDLRRLRARLKLCRGGKCVNTALDRAGERRPAMNPCCPGPCCPGDGCC